MAYKDSDEIETNSNYALGDYSFRIERSSVPGSSNDKIEAICTQGGKNARKSIQIPSSANVDGWYVEANGTEATVYALIKRSSGSGGHESSLDTSPIPQPVSSGGGFWYEREGGGSGGWPRYHYAHFYQYNCPVYAYWTGTYYQAIAFTGLTSPGTVTVGTYTYIDYEEGTQTETPLTLTSSGSNYVTYDGKTAYCASSSFPVNADYHYNGMIGASAASNIALLNAAWTMLYGTPVGPEEYEEKMVGRFAIDLEDAGGVGPGSDWVDPGDYDPDWEPEDPTHTLYVTVTGALSGRHNDPIADPSYSYIPADKDTVKDYGCGGDGGHGGGGGAGASTVVVHKFATNQANSKEITALARRHGYGSGGGKGGKGGDGCILVYY